MSDSTTVLVIADEAASGDALTGYLQEAGYQVFPALNNPQAFAQLAEQPQIDLVVVDRAMPTLEGLEVLKRIKRDPRRRDVPIIMQTPAGAAHRVLEGVRGGAFYYLPRPYDRAALLATVVTACADRRQARERRQARTGQQEALSLLDRGRFHFRTLEEARKLAHVVAACCPDPDRVVYGLCELMINAIEHGNLGITYHEKTALVRSGDWQREVERRLDLPDNRRKYATLDLDCNDQELLILIRDQGPGFDWKEYLEISADRAGDPNGRGVAMALAISFSSLEYRGCGNEAACTIVMDAPGQ
jgi:CheY-like chemotaxis protein